MIIKGYTEDEHEISKKSILLDASALLELYLRRPKSLEIQNILKEFEEVNITLITVGILFYYAEKEKLDMQIAEFLVETCNILSTSEFTYKIAKQIYNKKDLEDALQIACAKENNIETVLTLDKQMAKKYREIVNIVLV
jgi:predicted nucleic acid-binding protein